MPAVIPADALKQAGVFTLTQAIAAGGTVSAIRAALDAGRWVRLYRGVLAVPGPDTVLQKAWGIHLRCGACVVSHGTAASVLGFGVIPASQVSVTVPPDTRMRAGADLQVHRTLLAPSEIIALRGLPVTAPLRTILDVGRTWNRWEAVTTADAALHVGRCCREEILHALENIHGPGATQARAHLPQCADGAESPKETELRLLCLDGGLPPPVPQLTVLLPGFGRVRLDLGWPEARAGAEFDGRDTHLQAQTFVSDRRRHNALRAAGWDVRVFTGTDLRQRPEAVVAELRLLLRVSAA